MANVVDWSLDDLSLRKKLLILSKQDFIKACKYQNITYLEKNKKMDTIDHLINANTAKKKRKSNTKKKRKTKKKHGKSKSLNSLNAEKLIQIEEKVELKTEMQQQKQKVVLKVGILGDAQVGTKSLMVRYIDDKYDEDYTDTIGINFMEKLVHFGDVDVTISIYIRNAQKSFHFILPLICSGAKFIIFTFDLTDLNSLFSVKHRFKEARKENKLFQPILVGTKYDLFQDQDDKYKLKVTKHARKFSKKMHSSLIYCSSKDNINVRKIFKVIIERAFDLSVYRTICEQFDELKQPILEINLYRKEKIILIINGYIRETQKEYQWENRMPVDYFVNFMLMFYTNFNESFKRTVKREKLKDKKQRTKKKKQKRKKRKKRTTNKDKK